MCGVCVGGGDRFLFIVKFSHIKNEVREIFDGYLVDGFLCFIISGIGVCRFSRSSTFLE